MSLIVLFYVLYCLILKVIKYISINDNFVLSFY